MNHIAHFVTDHAIVLAISMTLDDVVLWLARLEKIDCGAALLPSPERRNSLSTNPTSSSEHDSEKERVISFVGVFLLRHVAEEFVWMPEGQLLVSMGCVESFLNEKAS